MILCVGLPKTGTSTMFRAFREAGYNAVHGRLGPGLPHSADAMQRAFMEGKNPLAYVSREVEFISDPFRTGGSSVWPTLSPLFLQSLRQHNPDMWVILNTRILKHWLKSIESWKNLHQRLVEADLPFLPCGQGKDGRQLTDWAEAYYNRVRGVFGGDGRFIEVAIENDNREVLGDIFGRDFPWWGRENVS